MNSSGDSELPARVYALLGPTNTGKTHRAIERMLEFESGMMGLPLRLLAREVYDRVSTRLGEQAVALVTGEEKRVPARPRYWVCTVEAMPREPRVAFLAVDEVQLVSHPERGHVFTERVLAWRGERETWFMGSEAAERLLRGFIPDLHVRKLPRLSRLTHIGQSSLRSLPRRSAVVAFNLPQVYELADALRARRGGAAVVLGALSPRVRNAQVALYQAGEVDFLVATDAIGMGLNLDIDHVALAARSKFDGFETRELESAELAQILGRAGRYLRDGTFGTLAPEPELPPGLVARLEAHRFPSLKFAYYRNAELDFSSIPALLSSLARKPPQEHLHAAPEADDLAVLRVLAQTPEVIAHATSVRGVQTLWDVCRIPNYEKRIPEHQAARLVPLIIQLVSHGELHTAYVERELARVRNLEGDIHQLTERLAAVRTWTYVSHQSGWVRDAESFRRRARELEERLGDVLHERLLERFVSEPGVRKRSRGQRVAQEAAARGSPFARLAQLSVYASEEREQARAQQVWVEQLVEARFEDLALDNQARVHFQGTRVARLATGPHLLRPALQLRLPEWVPPGSRGRIERRLQAHCRDVVQHLLAPLRFDPGHSAPLRGLLYQLEQGLGTIARREAAGQIETLDQTARDLLAQHEVALGEVCVFARPLLAPDRARIRIALCCAAVAEARLFSELDPDQPIWPLVAGLDRALLPAMGYWPLASLALRCDVLEQLRAQNEKQTFEQQVSAAMWLLGHGRETAERVIRELAPKRRRRRRVSSRRSRAPR